MSPASTSRTSRMTEPFDLGLSGARAVVTGAGRGIGLAVTHGLVSAGARVVAGTRKRTDALDDLLGPGADLTVVEVDLAEPDGPARLVAEAAGLLGGLDVLVNNVGAVRPRVAGFTATTDADWDWTFTVNLMSAVRATRAALPHLIDAGNARNASIVTVSSVNAKLPDPLVIDYSASKAALSNFCKALSKQVGPQGVRVNAVSPGPVSTDLWESAGGVASTVGAHLGVEPGAVIQNVASGTATGRFTTAREVADLVLFLAGPRSSNITGSEIVIDGGMIDAL